MRSPAILVVLLLAALVARADAASDLPALSDEFDSASSLADWHVMQAK